MISVVIPCFNEAAGIGELLKRLSAVCAAFADHEIVLVDDGSTDRTWAEIVSAAFCNRNVIGIKLSRNHGHQLALSAGLTIARGDRVLILDADLQDPPELLPEMMELMDAGADIVFGRRIGRSGETAAKKITAYLFYRLLSAMTEVPIPTDTGDFRLISRRALDVLLSMPERHRFIRGMVSWVGFTQKPIEYKRDARFVGETKYPLRKMISFAVDAITGFSTRPLRMATHLGVVVGVVSMALLGTAVYQWLMGHTVQGWTSSIGATLLLGSINLFVLGIIGEYLGRLYVESKRRPLFIIEEVVRSEESVNVADRTEAVS